jgi:hypothetical protein
MGDTNLPPRRLLVAVAAAGVVGPGVLNYAFNVAGYNTVGSAVWAVGYGIAALTVWYGWIRPLDIGTEA